MDIHIQDDIQKITLSINQGYDKTEILKTACWDGSLKVLKHLIENHGVDARWDYDWAVQVAAECGHFEMFKYLVEDCGADVRPYNKWVANLINKPIWTEGCLDVVRYLMEKVIFLHPRKSQHQRSQSA